MLFYYAKTITIGKDFLAVIGFKLVPFYRDVRKRLTAGGTNLGIFC